MKLLKPTWVHHDRQPIFSVDISPTGNRFATGGQGEDSGRVVIWNILPLIDERAEANELVNKKLCQLDNHVACVNCVRWSGNGTILASAGDDKIIMLWKLGKGPSAIFGSSGVNSENWRSTATLRGHSGDILDLAWSPQDKWLASSSVDNNIIIWDMNNLPSMVKILKGHSGLVKGVTWDPVGEFLASQSDDKTVKIWRTSDWACESTISEPFEDCSGTTHVLRLSWSPDGLYLVSAHAMNGGGPTAQIIEREGWECEKDFVGHRKAVTCVRFHQSILKRQAPEKKKSQQYCCLAVGSRDKSVSIWMTASKRPSAVIYDLFDDSVVDLSWSVEKNILLACSPDGSVACLMFSEEELGTSLSQEDKNVILKRMYGKRANTDLNESNAEKGMIVEYASLLETEDSKKSVNEAEPNSNTATDPFQAPPIQKESTIISSSDSLSTTSTPTKAISKQIETRRADGKRRITPMFIPMTDQDGENIPEPASSVSSRSISNSAFEKKMNERMTEGSGLLDTASPKATDPQTRTGADGSPMVTASSNANNPQMDSRLTKTVPKKTKLTEDVGQSKTAADETPALNAIIRQNIVAGKAVPLSKIVIKKHQDVEIAVLNNYTNTPSGAISKITCTAATNPWETFIGSPVVNFCICAKYVLICSLDCTLRFLDVRNGTPVMPVLHMPKPAIQCVFSMNSELGGIVSECGVIRIWNLTDRSIYISATCHDLLNFTTAQLSVAYFHVSEVGVIYVLLSNGCSYSYCKKLESWITLNSKDPIIRLGISSLPKNPAKSMKTYPLGLIQSTSLVLQPNVRSAQDLSNITWQSAAKLSFIENQIKVCEAISSPVELEHWYIVLGSHLAKYGTERRLRTLLDDLLGAVGLCRMYADDNTELQEKETILGIEKHKILTQILDNLKTIPKWHRIFIEYSDQLKDFN